MDLTADAVNALMVAGQKSAEAIPYENDDLGGVGDIPVMLVRDADGGETPKVFRELIDERESRAAGPRRRRGTSQLFDLASFIAWTKRYKEARSLVWADINSFHLIAVIDEHEPGDKQEDAGWRDFRAQYTMPRSPEWIAWTEKDGKTLSQEQFADFLEERLDDLTSGTGDAPVPTDVLTMARDLRVNSKGTFQRTLNPTTGNYTLVAKTETDTGSTVIYRAFLISIPVFDGGERYQCECRIRFQLVNGAPNFAFVMHLRKEIERDAFNGVSKRVADECAIPVYAGRP